MFRAARFVSVLLACLSAATAGCADPPSKEMDQAKGAIDAARAAGAEQYATGTLKEAQTAYDRSLAAVEQRDYRLALDRALDARERAQDAAKEASSQKARVRSEVERLLQEAEAALAAARGAIPEPLPDRRTRRARSRFEEPLAEIEATLARAREAIGREDFLGARTALDGVLDRIGKLSSEINAEAAARPPRRPARRGSR